MDKLYLKYKLKLSDLMRAVKYYELDNDPDIKSRIEKNNREKAKE